METSTTKNNRGFTLIEILLYLSLAVVMIVLIGRIGVNVMTGLISAKAEEELQYNVQFISEKIRLLVSESVEINSPVATASSSVLILHMDDVTRDPVVISVTGGSLFVQEGAGSPQIISGRRAVVSEVEFLNVTQAAGFDSVRMKASVGLINPSNRLILKGSATLSTTVSVQYP